MRHPLVPREVVFIFENLLAQFTFTTPLAFHFRAHTKIWIFQSTVIFTQPVRQKFWLILLERKNRLVSKRLDTHEFFWFGTNNSHVV